MKFLTATTLCVAALVSVIVCVPFLPFAKEQPEVFLLEARMTTGAAGHVQVYYDSGAGFEETKSSVASLQSGTRTYRLPLPSGEFHRFRFDPIDRDSLVTLHSLQVVTRGGQVIRDIPLSELKPAFQIGELRLDDHGLEIRPEKGGNDPQLLVAFNPPLKLEVGWRIGATTALRPIGSVFAVLAILLFLIDRASGLRQRIAQSCRRLAARPVLALSLTAGLAVIASSYPVVFLDKSYVSPNLGTVLLYETLPTLPGYTDTTTSDVMGSDLGAIMWQHIPLSVVEGRALRHGEIPLWNRYNSTGTPLLGQGQSMFGDPLQLLVIACGGASWAWDLKFLLTKWLFAVGLGLSVWTLLRSRTTVAGNAHPALPEEPWRSLYPSLIVAAAAPFVGFFLYRVNHPAIFSMCYAPWPLYCWLQVARSETRRQLAGWAAGLMLANLALMNSGTAKEAYMLLLTMNFSGVCVLLATPSSWRARFTKFGVLAWAGVLFGLLTAPIWGTFLHELHSAYTSYNEVSAYQIQPTLLIGAFDEIFYRPLMPNGQTFSPSLNFLLLLGVLYFAATLKAHLRNRMLAALSAASLVPLSMAFGLIPPGWIIHVPFLANIAHIDNTFSCALIVLWSILAGAGFAEAFRRLGTPEGRSDLVVAGLLLFALVFGWIAFGQVVHRPIYGPAFTVNQNGHSLAVPTFIRWYLASLLIAAVVLAAVARRALVRKSLPPAAAMLIGLCTIVLCWRMGQQSPASGFESYVFRPTTRVNFQAKSDAVRFIQDAQREQPSRAFGLRGNFFPGWNDVYALEGIHGPDALMNPWYRELTAAMGGFERIWDWRIYLEPKNVAAARPFLDALNVRFYLDLKSDQGLMGRTLKLDRVADLDVYESPSVWPRAFFTDRLFIYDRVGEFTEKIRTGDGRPFAAVQRSDLVAHPELSTIWGEWNQRTISPALHYRLSENNTEFDVHATGPGVVVLSEALWPGDFRAFVNGEKVPVIRLNHAFKGVALKGAGDYHVAFRCVPKGWYANLTWFGIGFTLFAASLILAFRSAPTRTIPLQPNRGFATSG